VVLTKADLVDDAGEAAVAEVRGRLRSLDVEVVATSTIARTGIDRVHDAAGPNGTLAVIGPSGAGKSALVNALVGDDTMAVGEVRAGDAKGRHTTVTRELWALEGGGVVIDTPGLRGVGLWEADLGVDLAFPDVFRLTEHCRFADCSHDHEPGCAVQAAVEAGELDAGRVAHYRDLVGEIADVDRRRTEQERARGERGHQPRGNQTGRRVTGRGKPRRRPPTS
jgi:ribosome biogenesis GTPase